LKQKFRISVLVSGGGTNLQSLIDSIKNGSLPEAEIVQVISSREDAFALERASRAGIKGAVISKKRFPDQDMLVQELIKTLEAAETDLIVLAGYMSVLHPDVIKKYPKRIINIHPSLIPKYSGKGFYGMKVHRAVIEAGEKVSGATVHFVDEGIDTGDIILQREVPVKEGDDENILAARVLEIEHVILPEAVQLIVEKENIWRDF
jgi:phosphoribosylglycinamide formyltransferase-1